MMQWRSVSVLRLREKIDSLKKSVQLETGIYLSKRCYCDLIFIRSALWRGRQSSSCSTSLFSRRFVVVVCVLIERATIIIIIIFDLFWRESNELNALLFERHHEMHRFWVSKCSRRSGKIQCHSLGLCTQSNIAITIVHIIFKRNVQINSLNWNRNIASDAHCEKYESFNIRLKHCISFLIFEEKERER